MTRVPNVDLGWSTSLPLVGGYAARALCNRFRDLPATIPHYFDFGNDRILVGDSLLSAASWEALRRTATPFGIPQDRQEWKALIQRSDLKGRARRIASIANEIGATRIASYGVGACGVEWHLKHEAPEIALTCTDYTPESVELLRHHFPEAQFIRHDLLVDPPLFADLHLFHRIDTEFDRRQWAAIFERFQDPILVVATGLLDWPHYVVERAMRRNPNATFSGYVRNRGAFRALWAKTHDSTELEVYDLPAFRLTRRSRS